MTSSSSLTRHVPSMKLSPPVSAATHVIRQRVRDLLQAAASARLVIVRAPAGFGKTTAMLQHRARLEHASVATTWLTLDSADNDPVRFLSGFDAAVSAIVGDDVLPEPARPVPHTIGEVALQAMDRLASHREPFAFFLDDFEVLQEPGVLAWVREIVDHLPYNGQLVIGTRCTPDLRLGRLRARGHLLEIDAAALRFSIDETEQFFRTVRPMSLAADDLLRLHRKTEGWAAALWLASASLERSDARTEFIDRFSGTSRSIADYLAEDVVARQPEPVRRFLLRTSLLRYLSEPLCRALMPDADCGTILRQLEAASLIVPIDSDGSDDRAWRYHSLIADFLKAQLLRDAPDEIAGLHRAAADWYLSRQRPVAAIDHALDGGDFAHAVALLAQHAPSLLGEGRMRLLMRWFDALPDAVLRDHLPLQAIRAWALTFTRGPWEAMELLDRSGLRDTADLAVRPHVLALQPTLLAMMDRFEEALDVGRACLAHWPTGHALADMLLANAMANLFAVIGEHAQSRRLIETARRTQSADGSAFNLMYSETVEAICDLQEGRLREASARLRIAVGAGSAHHYGHTGGNAWAGVMYAATVYEANDLAQAAHLLQVYVPLARDVLLADHVTIGHVLLSRIAFARGDVDDAFETLSRLEHLGHARRLARMVAGAKLERARVLLMQGHARAAHDEIARADEPGLWARVAPLHLIGNDLDYLALAQLRWEALAGDAKATAPRLVDAAARADAHARHRRAMKLRLLAALAHQRADEPAAAQALLGPLLKAACAEGYARLLLDEGGGHVGPLLRQFSRTLGASGGASRDPVLAEYVLRLVAACGLADGPADGFAGGLADVPADVPADVLADVPANAPANALATDKPALHDPLTRKEIRVLQLLAEGYSNNAIAEKLFVSDSTVRTHLRNINNKVDARSRTQAVAIARRLGVIG
ncbi:LuxR C-terminal-related transcriptional regulator [Burkholderia guangdongensis]|uniref:LuxR C-terminal-related transcriptional regulator n=1 Tax=Burkholderia guangdongensis TaxID=1792500 RepID=UPI0015CD423A|nr:LuxR C-terminal-related transcriptional regulator [Burkholderia guangdongensis]